MQFAGNTVINTFIHGTDAATVSRISETLEYVGRKLDGIQNNTAGQHSSLDDTLFQDALQKAQQMSEAGQADHASCAFMEALEEESRIECDRQVRRKRLRLQLLEEALTFDQRAQKAEAALEKLLLMSEIHFPGDQKEKVKFLKSRASDYEQHGKFKGDNSALLIALAILRWLTEEASNVAG